MNESNPGLTGAERLAVARARQLAEIRGAGAICDYTGAADAALAYAEALGEAQHLLTVLAAIAEHGGGGGQGAEDTRRLGKIRDLLADFDWEYHDRQLALEAIDRIVTEGDSK
jgi:hypothetical protein